MGSRYALALRRTPSLSLEGIADPLLKPEDAAAFGCPVYREEEPLISHSGIDMVVVAAPSHLHRELAVRAIEQNKHVLVEKPMALTLEDAREIIGKAASKSVKLTVGLVERFNPVYRKVKEFLNLSAVGDLVSLSAKRRTKSDRRPPWYPDPAKSGGVIVDLAAHDIDLMRWLVEDEVARVCAVSNLSVCRGAVDNAMVLLAFRRGVTGSLEASWRLDPHYPSWGDVRLEVVGTEGMLVADTGLLQPLYYAGTNASTSFIHPQAGGAWSNIDFSRDEVIVAMLESFAKSILDGTPLEVTGEDGEKDLEIALAATRSLYSEKPEYL
jgi:predicted dehydrogenase